MVNTTPYFIEQAQERYPKRCSLTDKLKTGFLVVGGGMTGLSAAYNLSNKVNPRSIILIDSGQLGFSTTGKSSGLLVDSVEDDFYETDIKVYEEVKSGVDSVVRTIRQEGIDCDLKHIPSLYYADEPEQKKAIALEYKARVEAGFDVQLLTLTQTLRQHEILALSAMRNNDGYCLDPASFCQELAKVLENKGVRIFEDTRLTGYDPNKKQAQISNGNIDYHKMLLTNTNPFLELNPSTNRALLCSAAVAVTEPLTDEQHQRLFPNGEIMGWNEPDTNYLYFRPVGDKRLLIGGSDRLVSLNAARNGVNPRRLSQDRTNVRRLFETTFPGLRNVQFSNEWSGIIPASIDCLALVGEFSPNHFMALYGGGLPISYRAGEILSEKVTGTSTPSHQLFGHDRKMPLSNRIRALAKYQPATSIANLMYF